MNRCDWINAPIDDELAALCAEVGEAVSAGFDRAQLDALPAWATAALPPPPVA